MRRLRRRTVLTPSREAGDSREERNLHMRRWLGRLAAAVLLALSATGCDHWAGVCDCDNGCYHGCCYGLGSYHGVMGEHYSPGAPHVGAQVHTSADTKPIPASPMHKVVD